jgi:hypothetical protein
MMKKTKKIKIYITVGVVLVTYLNSITIIAEEKALFDESKKNYYIVTIDSTWMLLSQTLYSHPKFWKNLRDFNPQLKDLKVIPAGVSIQYYSPFNKKLIQLQKEKLTAEERKQIKVKFDRDLQLTAGTEARIQPSYVILLHDSLSKISYKFYETTSKWKKLWQINKKKIKNFNIIFPGTTIKLLSQLPNPFQKPSALPSPEELIPPESSVEKNKEISPSSTELKSELPPQVPIQENFKWHNMTLGFGLGLTLSDFFQTGSNGQLTGGGMLRNWGLYYHVDLNEKWQMDVDFWQRSSAFKTSLFNESASSDAVIRRLMGSVSFNKWTLGILGDELYYPIKENSVVTVKSVLVTSVIFGFRHDKIGLTENPKDFIFSVDALGKIPLSINSSNLPVRVFEVSGFGLELKGGVKKPIWYRESKNLSLGLMMGLNYSNFDYIQLRTNTRQSVSTEITDWFSYILTDYNF